MHFYDTNTKSYGYVCFIGLSDEQREKAVNYMKKVELDRLDWPGITVINTVHEYRTQKGFFNILPSSYPYVVPMDVLGLICQAHITTVMKSTHFPVIASLQPHYSASQKLNRRVVSEDDWQRLFEEFLSFCDDASVQHAFQTGTNKVGYWGFGGPVQYDMTKTFLNFVTVGNGEGYKFDCSQKGGVRRILSELFQTKE